MKYMYLFLSRIGNSENHDLYRYFKAKECSHPKINQHLVENDLHLKRHKCIFRDKFQTQRGICIISYNKSRLSRNTDHL